MKDAGPLFRRSSGAVAPAPDAPAPVAGTAPAPIGSEGKLCWKKSFGRGVGTVPTAAWLR